MAILISTNPAKNYKRLGSVRVSTPQEIKRKVELANRTKASWKELGVAKRTKLLKPLYRQFLRQKEEIALLVTREIGKPITEAISDLDWDTDYFKDFLRNGPKYLKDEITHQEGKAVHKIIYEPIGTAAVIVPWNFPFANFLWGVVPNLIVGNTVVFKHSEECPLSGKLFEEMMDRLDLPKGVFSEVYGDGKTGEILVRQNIDFIWFTGSSRVGKELFEKAGKKFIKSTLEMGGSNPAVVFGDVDVDDIIDQLYNGRFFNNGQVCDAIKRLIVHEKVFDEIVEKLRKRVEKAVVGNPEDKKTDLGSLVAKRQLETLESQVRDAVKKGAKIVTGGSSPRGFKGAYYLPTLLVNVKRNMMVWKEEVFGPVLPIISFKAEREAVELANDTKYGLGAVVFSRDKKRALKVASKIEAGCIDINTGDHWLPCNPFGGYKESGMGREHGSHGFRELCQIKVVASG
jgi:acyl-CoA reductase-like NAD-dependent aldehyde dehydrogenase